MNRALAYNAFEIGDWLVLIGKLDFRIRSLLLYAMCRKLFVLESLFSYMGDSFCRIGRLELLHQLQLQHLQLQQLQLQQLQLQQLKL